MFISPFRPSFLSALIPVIGSVRGFLSTIADSLSQTVAAIVSALRHRNTSEFAAIIKEGSPLERLVDSLLSAAFWVLVLAPVLLVPLYFLLLSLK